jgi:hypothetical protein
MKKYIVAGVVVVVIIIGAFFAFHKSNKGGAVLGSPASANLDAFAQCIANSGAKFYGAFWCPHCKDQKADFGSSVQYLPYVECSTPDGLSQTQACKDKNIQGYPTWIFADGSQVSGEQTLETLAQKTGCVLPK